MAFGLQISNPSGDLVVSSDAKMLHYLAKAVWQSTTQLSPGSGSSDPSQQTAPGTRAGYSTYQLTVPAGVKFLLAIDLPTGSAGTRMVGITGCAYLSTSGGNDIYRVTAYNGDQTFGSLFDYSQYPLDIWAFGFVNSTASNWGLALYDSAGNLSADFTRAIPLFPKFISDFKTTKTQTIPALTRPVLIGMPGYYWADIHEQGIGYLYTYIREVGLWNRSNATTLTCGTRYLQQHGCNEFPTNDEASTNGPSVAILIEGSNLP